MNSVEKTKSDVLCSRNKVSCETPQRPKETKVVLELSIDSTELLVRRWLFGKLGWMNSIISPLNARWGSRGARLVRLTSVLSSHSTEAKHHCEHPHWAMDFSPATTHPNSFSTNFKLCRMYSYISFNQQKAVLAKKHIQSSTTMTYFAACQKNWRNHLIQFGDLSE